MRNGGADNRIAALPCQPVLERERHAGGVVAAQAGVGDQHHGARAALQHAARRLAEDELVARPPRHAHDDQRHLPAGLPGNGIGGGGAAADGGLDLDAVAIGQRDDVLQHRFPAAMRDGVARLVAADPAT